MNAKRLKNNLIILLLASLCLFNLGCKDDDSPCSAPVQGPEYTLSDNIKAYIANYESANSVIFVDEVGAEKVFALTGRSDTIGSYGFGRTCEFDNILSQFVQGTAQIIKLYLTNEELAESIYLQVVEYPETESSSSYEAIQLFFGDLIDLTTGDGLFSYTENGVNVATTIHDSLVLNGTTFYDVIDIDDVNASPKLKILYTKSLGIVYIKNYANDREYFYTRTE